MPTETVPDPCPPLQGECRQFDPVSAHHKSIPYAETQHPELAPGKFREAQHPRQCCAQVCCSETCKSLQGSKRAALGEALAMEFINTFESALAVARREDLISAYSDAVPGALLPWNLHAFVIGACRSLPDGVRHMHEGIHHCGHSCCDVQVLPGCGAMAGQISEHLVYFGRDFFQR